MIKLDGSRFFFDIEGVFSGLCGSVREKNAALPGDPKAAALRQGFSRFFQTVPENVRVAESFEKLLFPLLDGKTVVIPAADESADHFSAAFPGKNFLLADKPADLKIRPAALAEFVAENGADALYLTNPCCPTSLELSAAEVETLISGTKALVIVDESHMVGEENSAVSLTKRYENLVVLKKMRFGGEGVFAVGQNLPDIPCELSAADQAAGTVIFERDSALKTALRKLTDSRDSLYIRVKKLAIKYDSVERLYRTKADHVFFKVKDAERRAEALSEKGILIRQTEGGFCIFAGDKPENEAVLAALEEVLQ